VIHGTAGAAALVLALAGGALLVLGSLDHGGLRQIRWRMGEALSWALGPLAAPLEPIREHARDIAAYFNERTELKRLRAENQRLMAWEWRAMEAERKLAELAGLAKLAPEAPVPFVTARVVAQSSGPFAKSAIIDAGRRQGLSGALPVITADGLAGRLVETGESQSRVLFITDLNSRIPVLVGKDGARALLIGDSSGRPRLDFLGEPVRAEPGDDVATSGAGGIFPRGLRIGKVVAGGERPRVAPLARLEDLGYVSILIFEGLDRGIGTEERKPRERRKTSDLDGTALGGRL